MEVGNFACDDFLLPPPNPSHGHRCGGGGETDHPHGHRGYSLSEWAAIISHLGRLEPKEFLHEKLFTKSVSFLIPGDLTCESSMSRVVPCAGLAKYQRLTEDVD